MRKKYVIGGVAASIVVAVILFLIAYILVDHFLEGEEAGVVTIRTNTVVKYACPSGAIVADAADCGSATSTVATSSGADTTLPAGCPTTLPCNCPGGKKPISTTTSTIKLGPPCDTDSDCGQVDYAGVKCSSGSVYNIKVTPTCDDGHCKDLYTYEFKEECPSGKRCVTGEGCVAESEAN